MLLIAIMIGLAFGSLLLRRKTLATASAERIEPSVRTVRASVDGKPVHSYVMENPQ